MSDTPRTDGSCFSVVTDRELNVRAPVVHVSFARDLERACRLALERFEKDGWPLNEANTAAIAELRRVLS